MAKRSRSEAAKLERRCSGVLLHPTSLPGPFGIGSIGGEARRFVELLAASGQSVWQMLPTGPGGRDLCPYMPMSSFAGNELLIDLEELSSEGLLDAAELPQGRFSDDRVEEARVRAFFEEALAQAYPRRSGKQQREIERFRSEEAAWLEDYALYRAVHRRSLLVSWPDWPRGLALREAASLARARRELKEDIDAEVFRQWLFARQWQKLRAHATANGVALFGDLPLYVNHDSADVWMHPRAFRLDAEGMPSHVTGVPGDPAFPQGQLWGHPCYDWERMRRDGYAYFVARVRALAAQFDWVRIDHFRGLEAYWEIEAPAVNARVGSWRSGPGAALFRAIREQCGELALVAEDLGHITGPVRALLEEFRIPGMIVLQFAWWRIGGGFHPLRHRRRRVVYTGTHDTNTTRGWFEEECSDRERRNFELWLGRGVEDPAADLIGLAMASPADIAIVPAQDWLGLGTEARMNVPGVPTGQWTWRLRPEQLARWPGRRMRRAAEQNGRT